MKKMDCKQLNSLVWLVSLILIGFNIELSFSSQTQHRGSSKTNDYSLSVKYPDARIQINTSNVVIIAIDLPHARQQVYKVGLELLAMQLCDVNDRLKIVYSDPQSIQTLSWKHNTSDPAFNAPYEIRDIEANQVVIIPEGRWTRSGADIVATLYRDSLVDGSCPGNSVPCPCSFGVDTTGKHPSSNESMNQTRHSVARCISQSLLCNGNPNCGFGCRDDESSSTCDKFSDVPTFSSSVPTTPCVPPFVSTTEQTIAEGAGSGSKFRSDVSMMVFIFVMLSGVRLFG